MNRTTLIALTALALAPLPLHAQRTPAQRIEAARARAAQVGIPVELLQQRIAEGRAKGVPEDRIAAAVERREAGLERAQDALRGTRTTPPELGAAADALDAGVDAQSIRTVIQAARAEERPVALAVLAELVRQGMPMDQALASVTAAIARRGDALARLPEQAAAARARQHGPPAGVGHPVTPRGGPPAGVPGAGQKPGSHGHGKP
jgi:hypothetical protein